MKLNYKSEPPFSKWLAAPYDPRLAAAAVKQFEAEPKIVEMIEQRHAAFANPEEHLVVDDVFPNDQGMLNKPYVVFCSRGHQFVGQTPAEARALAEKHVREEPEL